jgi:hypothetical protein
VDALEQGGRALQGQSAGGEGLGDAGKRAQDCGAIAERPEADGGDAADTVLTAGSTAAAVMEEAEGGAGEGDGAAEGPTGRGSGAESGVHEFLLPTPRGYI